jgi:hypothetical protein
MDERREGWESGGEKGGLGEWKREGRAGRMEEKRHFHTHCYGVIL